MKRICTSIVGCLLVLTAMGQGIEVRWDTDFATPGVNGEVHALVVFENKLYVAGIFTYAGAAPAHRLAVFDLVSRTWSPLDEHIPNGDIRALAISPEGELFVGGRFSSIGSVEGRNIASYNLQTREWKGLGEGITVESTYGGVETLKVDGYGNLWVGGMFERAGGIPVRNFARWSRGGWDTIGNVGSGYSEVFDIATWEHEVCVVGSFDVVDGQPSTGLACWNALTTSWERSNAFGQFDRLSSLLGTDEGIYVAGRIRSVRQADGTDLAVSNLAFRHRDTGMWESTGAELSEVSSMAMDADGVLHVSTEATDKEFLHRYADGLWSALRSGFAVQLGLYNPRLAYGDGVLFVGFGGLYTEHVGPTHFLYALQGVGRPAERWAVLGDDEAGITGEVVSILVTTSDRVFAGGWFSFAGVTPADNVAEWEDTAWKPLAGGLDGFVETMIELPGERILMGGRIFAVTDHDGRRIERQNLAVWDAGQERWEEDVPGYPGIVYAMAAGPDNRVYVAGRTDAGEGRLCYWDLEASDTRCEYIPDTQGLNEILSIALDNAGRVVVGGSYTNQNGFSIGRLGRFDPSIQMWDVLGEWPLHPVTALLLDKNGDYPAYVGLRYGGTQHWDGTQWQALGEQQHGGVTKVNTLAWLSGTNVVLVAGESVRAWTGESWHPIFHPGGFISEMWSLASTPDVQWIGGRFNSFSDVPASSIIRGVVDVVDLSTDPMPVRHVSQLVTYPNPAVDRVFVSFTVEQPGRARIAIVDMLGREMMIPIVEDVQRGEHQREISTTGLPSGVYVVVVSTPTERSTTLMTILH